MNLLKKLFRRMPERTRPYCAALIAAAGSSTRYGGENKLLQELGGIPVLARTLLAVDRAESIDEIVIAAREDEFLTYAQLCKTFDLQKPVKVVLGGATRTESVLRAACEASPEAALLAVQDGARPLVTSALIDEVVLAAQQYHAAAPAIPVTDTVKVAVNGVVESTPERSKLFAVQTPQVFDAELLKAALQDALYLAGICSKVYLIHRRDTFRAEKSLIDQVMAEENIECVMESRVTALIGEKKLTELEVTNLSGEKKTLVADGLFVAIGMGPHNEVFRDLVDLDEAGYVIAGENCKTRTPGVYAAGDCRTKTVRQLTTAAADGTVCGLVCKAV